MRHAMDTVIGTLRCGSGTLREGLARGDGRLRLVGSKRPGGADQPTGDAGRAVSLVPEAPVASGPRTRFAALAACPVSWSAQTGPEGQALGQAPRGRSEPMARLRAMKGRWKA